MTQEEFFSRYTYDVAVDRIGGGGFGTVYKAFDNLMNREVAIKVSEVKTTSDGKKTFSLKDEFEALSHVPKHRNIANYEEFYSFKMPNGIFDYAVMQYYPDGNLTNAIKEGMTDEQKEEVAMQLLEGIDFLHKHKVVHRDLKPGNILVVEHGGHIIPLITDFGLSKAADTGDGSQFSNSFGGGTQRYSSPEQLQGKPLRFNTDLWSYGAIVYELFMGEQLFSPGSGASNSAQAELEVYNKIIHGDVSKLGKMPERWRKVAERCMVVDPEKRVKSAEELIYILKGYEEATEVEPQPVQPVTKPAVSKPVNNKPEPPKADKPSGGKKKGKGLWIGLAAVAVIALVLVLLLKPKEDTPAPVDPDTEAFLACQTVNDYRDYLSNYGKTAHYYAEVKRFVDSVVADSTAKAEELLAQQQVEAEAKAKDDAEKKAFDKCTTIEACDKYLKAYPEGKYVDEVRAKKAELEREDEAFKKCTTVAACNQYLKDYPNGHYVDKVKAIKVDLEKVDLSVTQLTNSQNTNNSGNTSTSASSTSLTFTANGVSFVMKRVEGGTFQMGAQKTNSNGQNYDSDAYGDESPVHSVTVSTFYMGETEVTQALWKAVMGNNPSYFKGDNLPVEQVSWKDCLEFIFKLNRLTEKNFRLPTEAEWEYAARGRKNNGYKYAGSNSIGDVAWYKDNSGNNTHPVKSKTPNELGLYDMSGNVSEWCSDGYERYSSSSQKNPEVKPLDSFYVLRGGDWFDGAGRCRVSCRRHSYPGGRGQPLHFSSEHVGFRLVLPQ